MNFLFFVTTAIAFNFVHSQKIVCYYGSWATFRSGNGKFDVSNIDPFKCTHLIYAFVGLEEAGSTIKLLNPTIEPDNLSKFNALKKSNPSLKTLVALGGWNEGSSKYSRLAADPQKRAVLAANAKNFVLKYGFDGLDVDWEYPAQRDGDASIDKQNYVFLLQALRNTFLLSGLLLTAAVGASAWSAGQSYNIPQISAALDHIHLMTYDFTGAWAGKTGFNAPMSDIEASVKYWIDQGADASKLILGMPFYGKTFTLSNSADNVAGTGISGSGLAGPYTQEAGSLGYNEICEQIVAKKLTVKWDDAQSVPFAFGGDQWVSYDDVKSISIKTAYVANNGLGGAMAWSIETDDFSNNCGLGKFPLLTAINDGLNLKSTSLATTSTQSISSTQTPLMTTTAGSITFVCATAGIFTDPDNCRGFIMCDAGLQKYQMSCATGLVFDPTSQACNWPQNTNVQCGTAATVSTTTTTLATFSTISTKPTSTTTPSTTKQSSSIFICSRAGMFADPVNCHGYIVCDGSLKKFSMGCPAGLVFDPINSICNWPYNTNVKCV